MCIVQTKLTLSYKMERCQEKLARFGEGGSYLIKAVRLENDSVHSVPLLVTEIIGSVKCYSVFSTSVSPYLLMYVTTIHRKKLKVFEIIKIYINANCLGHWYVVSILNHDRFIKIFVDKKTCFIQNKTSKPTFKYRIQKYNL